MRTRRVELATVPLIVVGALSVVAWVLGATRHLWASREPGAALPYGVTFRGGETFFFSMPVGWWLDNGLWIFLAALGLAMLADRLGKGAPR